MPSLVPSTVPSLENLIRSLLFVPYLRADGESFPLLFLGWTLNYEAFFYAVFALALALGGRRAPLLALVMLGGVIGARPWLAGLGFAFEFWTSPILLNFICGIFAWYVWRLAGVRQRAVPAWLAGLAALACLAAFALGLGPRLGGTLPWNGVLGVMLLLALLRLDGAVRWPAWLLLIGDASYSLYLLHPYVLELFNRLLHPFGSDPAGIAVTLIAVLLAVGVAVISFRLLERPSNHALRRLLT
jgi:peptidoglycan/LPS O-acetylase OafA/YrhL